MTTLGFAIFYLSWEFVGKYTHHDEELILFNANLVPFVLFWGCLLHATVGSIAFLVNRKFMVKYFRLWNEVVDQLHIPLPHCVRRFLLVSNVLVLTFFATCTVIYYNE
jgi:hypothetical protein